jgi:hypothetical protein
MPASGLRQRAAQKPATVTNTKKNRKISSAGVWVGVGTWEE